MEAHTGIADTLFPWTILLAVGLVALMLSGYLARRPDHPTWLPVGGYLAAAVVVLGSALSLYWMIRIGDAGTRAAWTDVVEAGG